MARTIDHEVTAEKEDIFTHSSQETGGTACHLGPCGEAPGFLQKVERVRKSMGKSLSYEAGRKAEL